MVDPSHVFSQIHLDWKKKNIKLTVPFCRERFRGGKGEAWIKTSSIQQLLIQEEGKTGHGEISDMSCNKRNVDGSLFQHPTRVCDQMGILPVPCGTAFMDVIKRQCNENRINEIIIEHRRKCRPEEAANNNY